MKRYPHLWLVVGLLAATTARAQHFSAADRPMPPIPRAVWSNGLAVVGSVLVDPTNRCVLAQGYVNQTNGLVELFACGPNGKTHESILVLQTNPLDLQTGLLLLGLKPDGRPQDVGLWPKPWRGPQLDLWVEWQQNGQTQRRRAEELVQNLETERALPTTPWIFTGSVIEHGVFRALSEESLIATYWDPWALLNLPLACGADDHILSVNAQTVPPLGTPVRLRLQVHQPSWWERLWQ
ncbi:MAG: hypothetical protein EPN23_08615 [Verrucomicrobia bacterium]|nr:MAG: hypothetical protein EPN23_08615 [Verrucomicrobiota bacterium]